MKTGLEMALSLNQAVLASSFVRIPPEIRVDIYEKAIGSPTIHIGYPGGQRVQNDRRFSGAYLCSADITDEQALAHLDQVLPVRHQDCKGSLTGLIALTSVCKQVCDESKFVIFKASQFTFFGPLSLIDFTNGLSDAQLKAIGSIVTYHAHGADRWSAAVLSPPAKPLLPGLRHLKIVVELCYDDYSLLNGASLKNLDAQNRRYLRLALFKSNRLKHVEVLISNGISTWEMGDRRRLSEAELEAWRNRIKERLLPSNEAERES